VPRYGPFRGSDRVRPAARSVRRELESIQRTCDDLAPLQDRAPRSGGVLGPVIAVALGLVALMAFLGWLLASPPIGR